MSKYRHSNTDKRNMRQKSAVISDVDGTLVKGSLVLNHACYLHDHGIIDLGDKPARWKRSKKNEVRIKDLAEEYRNGIIGKTIDEVHAKSFVNSVMSNPDNFYSSLTRIAGYRKRGWSVYLISGSPSFLLTPFARKLNFKSKGSLYKQDEDGRFTGECVGMFSAPAKEKHLRSLKTHAYGHVIAFGDTASDLPLFEAAHHSVLVHPNKQTSLSIGHHAHEVLLK